jgi:DNA-binding response OmpR family regulator
VIDATVDVLLIEDDESLRPILVRHLTSKGLRVAEADSAETATAQLTRGLRPALVLLDLNLPGATGWEFLRSDVLERAGRPPVVVTTATTVAPGRLREHAVAGYLPKPFAMETLVATVDRLLPAEALEDHP